MPQEPPVLPMIMRHLAVNSARREGDGYVWKFDENLMGGWDSEEITEGELFDEIELPLDFVAGELSQIVPAALARRIGKAMRNGRGPIVIPGAHHHIPVNQPLALVAALRALLA